MEHNAAEILAEQVGNDIRQVINASQMWRASNTSMKYTDIKNSMNRIEKDKVVFSYHVGCWAYISMLCLYCIGFKAKPV